MRLRPSPILAVALLAAACGGLEAPDLSTGAVAGRVTPAFPGGRVYVLGRPELAAPLAGDGSFYVGGVPAGPARLVALDGGERAGLLAVEVRGADVTWIGASSPAPAAPPPGPSGPSDPASGDSTGPTLPLAGFVHARALGPGGAALADARFTVAGTDLVEVAAGAAGDALLGPLPPGAFELVVRAGGHGELRAAVEVRSGETLALDVTLAPGP